MQTNKTYKHEKAFSIVNAQSREELLQLAVIKGEVAKAKEILAAGPLKEGKLVGSGKSLMIAVTNNDVPMALALIEGGVNAAWKDYAGNPILSKAINPIIVKALIDHGADIYYDCPIWHFAQWPWVDAATQKKDLEATRKALVAQKLPVDAVERGMKQKKALYVTKQDICDVVKVYDGIIPVFTVRTTAAIQTMANLKAELNHIAKDGDGIFTYYSKAIHGAYIFDNDLEPLFIDLAKCVAKYGIKKEIIEHAIQYIKDNHHAERDNQANYLKFLESIVK